MEGLVGSDDFPDFNHGDFQVPAVNFPGCNGVTWGGRRLNLISSLYHMSVEAEPIWIIC